MSERSSGDIPGSNIPLDQVAPDLGLIWYPEETQRVHFSNLTPDPEAQVDMKTWAKMFSQFQALDRWDEVYAFAELPGQGITIDFPVYGSYNEDGPCTTITCSFTEFMSEGEAVVGRRGFSLAFDVTRPGYIEVYEGNVALPEKVSPDERFTDCDPSEDGLREGLYMASDGSSVGYRFAAYIMNQRAAGMVCDLLSQATLSSEEEADQRFNVGIEHMEPSLREAVHRQYVLGKSLVRTPERDFKETEWSWDYLPSQIGRQPNVGLLADHRDRFESYGPPGTIPSDSEATLAFLRELGEESNEWIRATWDKEQLPDDFDPLFTEPTKIEALTAAELLEAISDGAEAKQHIARWAQEQLFWRRNWIDHTKHGILSVINMEESEFEEHKRRDKAGEEHFQWSLMPSFRVCLKNALHLAGDVTTYPEWMARYDELAGYYTTTYRNYAEVIHNYPNSDEERAARSEPSIWEGPEEREELYKLAWQVFQKLAESPKDPEPEPQDLPDDFEL